MQAGRRLTSLVNQIRAPREIGTRTMSTSGAPRWQSIIEKSIEEDKDAYAYQLATLESSSTQAGGWISSAPAPRVRTIAHRAILAPRSPKRPILLTTTDARTPKATQLANNTRVELAWWFPKPQTQLRIIGTAYIYPSPDFVLTGAENVSEERKKEIEDTVRELRGAFPGKELGGGGFDWERERRVRFDAMGGHLRASWARPVPGSRLNDPSEAKKWPESLPRLDEAGDKKQLVETALKNFALVIIDPSEVEYLELAIIPNRRTRFFREGEEWKEEALVP